MELFGVEHARQLVEDYKDLPSRYHVSAYNWAKTVIRLANALEDTGVPSSIVEKLALG